MLNLLIFFFVQLAVIMFMLPLTSPYLDLCNLKRNTKDEVKSIMTIEGFQTIITESISLLSSLPVASVGSPIATLAYSSVSMLLQKCMAYFSFSSNTALNEQNRCKYHISQYIKINLPCMSI